MKHLFLTGLALWLSCSFVSAAEPVARIKEKTSISEPGQSWAIQPLSLFEAKDHTIFIEELSPATHDASLKANVAVKPGEPKERSEWASANAKIEPKPTPKSEPQTSTKKTHP